MPDPSRITAGELVLVCSRYDLGAIQSLRRIRGGSRESPKVLVVSDRGRFLLKRRAPSPGHSRGGSTPSPEDLAHRVALSHQVQLHLGSRGFPIAPLVGTRTGNNSLLELNGFIYEVFRFMEGRRYDHTAAAARAAGRLLADLHRELHDLHPQWTPSEVTYHNQPAVVPSIREIAARTSDARTRSDLIALGEAYQHAATEAERLGVLNLPAQLIHADWHPGNLLYVGSTSEPSTAEPAIVAVIDFDSVRLGRPVMDLANGALQFAVVRRPTSPSGDRPGRTGDRVAGRAGMPSGAIGGGGGEGGATHGIRVNLDQDLLREFCAGYLSQPAAIRLREVDLAVVPWLMIEAMVVETIAPIAATGQFGKVSARAAVAMSRQATSWLTEHAQRLASLAAGR